MKIKPMLGEFALDNIEYIESSESRALVEHRVPGLAGNYFQDMGTAPNTIVIGGSKQGDEARDSFLEGIREIFNAGEPTTFVADINTATDLTEVVIEDLEVAEVGGSPDSFRYMIKLRKYIEPPEPPALGLLDTSILDDALKLVDALDILDALGSIPNLGDPTEPLRGALGEIQKATGGLDQTVNDLRNLFAREAKVGPAAVPEGTEGAEGTEGGGAGPAPSAEDLRIDPEDPRIDGATGSTLQNMLENPETAGTGARLVQGINGGNLAGILGADSEVAQQLAAAHGTSPLQLIPAGQDAALVLNTASPLEGPPTILVRPEVRNNSAQLAAALEEEGRTFEFFQRGELGPCDSMASAIPVPNLVPSSFCRIPAVAPGAVSLVDEAIGSMLESLVTGPDPLAPVTDLAQAIETGMLSGIHGEDSETLASIAGGHGLERRQLVPKGQDAALVLDPVVPLAVPPTVVVRRDALEDPARLANALEAVGRTFALFQTREVGRCVNAGSSVILPNLTPSEFCHVQPVLPSPPVGTEVGEPPEVIDPLAPDLQIHHLDSRVDVGAKFALKRMLNRIDRPDMQRDAASLIRGINGETLAGIFGDDLGKAVEAAEAHGTHRLQLVPKGEDAVLVLEVKVSLDAPPTVIFRGDTPDIRDQPGRIDPALQKASQTFDLFLRGQIASCSTPGAAPVTNLVPNSFCRVEGGRLTVLVLDSQGDRVAAAQVHIEGPVTRDRETDLDGHAIFNGVLPGEYEVRVLKEGFPEGTTRAVVTSRPDSPTIHSPLPEQIL